MRINKFYLDDLIRHIIKETISQRSLSIDVQGGSDFVEKTNMALQLLNRVDLFNEAKTYIGRIKEFSKSGMDVYTNPPTFQVGNATWNASLLWYASTIAHDAYHSKLYHEAKKKLGKEPPLDAWTGVTAEKQCIAFQRKILQALSADKNLIQYLDSLENPDYQNIPYQQRYWE